MFVPRIGAGFGREKGPWAGSWSRTKFRLQWVNFGRSWSDLVKLRARPAEFGSAMAEVGLIGRSRADWPRTDTWHASGGGRKVSGA